MTSLFIGIYGLYIVVVGYRGNVPELLDNLSEDVSGYMPWLAAIVVLAMLAQSEKTRDLVMPFIALLALNYFLRNYNTISDEIRKTIYGE